ncbi:uncharacterized protein (TIGR02646 family) [Sphingobium xenophagum]|uniref:Uncharacterized protein (TIGR02646 family) n=1 Tax=Sphingobium xenophagum TaxID=121428 RepID=A0ABU1X2A4_SPHXE|nr:AAA family ATPase [Sphingobium xenophagum]MDR7155691.1 uncharacterized protein (TIGR02646 family) [Sphingobium xenophagum]
MRYFDRNLMSAPTVLSSAPFENARRQLLEYVHDPDERRQRQRRAPYDPRLLTNPEIKEALAKNFGFLCAYCETDMRGFEFFDVEHHRPKASAAQHKGQTQHLYYVWLAYEWDNLLPICRTCNNAKRNKFYVAGERGAIGASVQELREQERALLLDPCFSDIAQHLGFDLTGMARPKSEDGKATIETLALNRKPLVEQRCNQLAGAINMLSTDKVPACSTTGFPNGWSSWVFAQADGGAIPHAGATTLAILEVATRVMPQITDLRVFLDLWGKLPGDVKGRFQAAFNGEDYAPQPPLVSVAPKASKTAQGPPRFKVNELPSAERPIASVRIENFKALSSIALSLPTLVETPDLVPCMLLLGENATGKSSVLEAIALALLGTGETRALDKLVEPDKIGPEDFVHRPNAGNWNVIASAPLMVDVQFTGVEATASLRGIHGQADFEGSITPSKIVLGYGPRRYFPNVITRRFRAAAHRVRSLFDPMSTITNPIGWLRKLEERDSVKFDAAVRALRIVLMLGDEALIQTEGGHIMVDSPQGRIPLTKMSVGYKSVIAMAIDIMRELFVYYDNLENAHAVVLVDEIETHLHPRWKMRIVGLLREAFPRVQFILTTHDPLCLRGMYQGEVFVLRRDDADNAIETLSELPNVEGMRADQILTSEFFGLGSTDPTTDAKVERYQFLTGKAGRNDDEEAERLRLADEIEGQMMVGSTIEQQTQAEAARRADLDAPIILTQVRDGDRKRMVKDALAKLMAE